MTAEGRRTIHRGHAPAKMSHVATTKLACAQVLCSLSGDGAILPARASYGTPPQRLTYRRQQMKFVIQRVTRASVTVDNEIVGQIGKGFLVLIGVSGTDTKEIADKVVKKMLGLRIFEDENGKTNLSLEDVGGELLLISQFTLYADCKKGNRPSFTDAGGPEMANELYEYIIEECKKSGKKVEKGIFGADMKVELLNDGPFTIVLDSEKL